MSTWTVTPIDIAQLEAWIMQAQSRALTTTMQAFQTAAAQRYAGTRFADTFTVTPRPIVREATLFSTHELFTVVEERTQAHEIRAKNGTVLRWIGPGGTPRFAVRVWH